MTRKDDTMRLMFKKAHKCLFCDKSSFMWLTSLFADFITTMLFVSTSTFLWHKQYMSGIPASWQVLLRGSLWGGDIGFRDSEIDLFCLRDSEIFYFSFRDSEILLPFETEIILLGLPRYWDLIFSLPRLRYFLASRNRDFIAWYENLWLRIQNCRIFSEFTRLVPYNLQNAWYN